MLKDKEEEDNKKEIEQLKNQIDKLIDKVNTPSTGNTYHTHIATTNNTTNNEMNIENFVLVSTSLGIILENAGLIKTSSNVSDSDNFIFLKSLMLFFSTVNY